MGDIIRNWQTSAAGFAAIALAIYHILSGDYSHISEDLMAIAVGFGLIAAKDAGTK
ncbi:MAG: hypothetical protein MN733_05110 [Nitrososphaera sp.]|nr:hypothetical protein [Nitrososphaera sp.]